MSHRLVSDKRRAWTQAFSSLSPCFQLLHCTASVLLQTLGCYWFTISVSLNFSYFNQSDLTFSVLFLFEIQLKSFFGKTQVCFLFIHFSHLVVSDSATRWTVARQAPLYVNFSRQKFWSGLPFPLPQVIFTTQGSLQVVSKKRVWATREAWARHKERLVWIKSRGLLTYKHTLNLQK